jgi:hypothetical protein
MFPPGLLDMEPGTEELPKEASPKISNRRYLPNKVISHPYPLTRRALYISLTFSNPGNISQGKSIRDDICISKGHGEERQL